MKFSRNILDKDGGDEEKRWPRYVFGGRMRTSTVALIVAFVLVWWLYDTYRPEPAPKAPPAQVVPPGFVPDPDYTWVPRTRVQKPPVDTYTPGPTTTPTTTTPPPPPTIPPTSVTTPPPFVLPTLPCIPPFCTPTTTPATSPATPAPQQPLPGPGPSPTPAPPAG